MSPVNPVGLWGPGTIVVDGSYMNVFFFQIFTYNGKYKSEAITEHITTLCE